MNAPPPLQAIVFQDTDVILLARVRSIDGTYIQQSNLSSIALTVYDKNDSMAVVVGPLTLTIGSVVFDSLQPYDGILWTVDRTGWNFKHRLAGATGLPEARDYRVDVIFTLTDGTTFPLQYDLTAEPVP